MGSINKLTIVAITALGFVVVANGQPTADIGKNTSTAQEQMVSQPSRKLFPNSDGSAFLDVNGRIVINGSDPQLQDELRRISRELGGFREPRAGALIDVRFERFSEGLAVIGWALCPMCRNPFWVNGFVDENGRMVIPPKTSYTRYGHFREGLAKYTGHGWGFIDRTGREVIPAQYTDVGDFSNGLAFVAGPERERYGYINKAGELVIPFRFKYASDFHEGLALVILMNGQYAFIDRTGKVVLQSRNWQGVDHFSEGLALVRLSVTNNKRYRGYQELKYGFMDRSGRIVIAPQFSRAEKFSEGRALIGQVVERASTSTREGVFGGPLRVGFIDRTGNVVIKPEYVQAKGFSEGLAAVAVMSPANKMIWGFIDREGKVVITPQFTNAGSFSGGLAAVNCDDYSRNCKAYVDREGKIVWQAGPARTDQKNSQ